MKKSVSIGFIFFFLSLLSLSGISQAQQVHQIADGDVTGLIQAMEEASRSPEADSIVLAKNAVYLLTKRHSCVTSGFYDYRSSPPLPCREAGTGPVGLPQITRKDWGGKLIINGRGATIKRAESVERFRIFYVWTSGEADFYNLTLENGYANRTLTSARVVISGGAIQRFIKF